MIKRISLSLTCAILILNAGFGNQAWAKPQTLKVLKVNYVSKSSGKGPEATDAVSEICAKSTKKCEFTCAQIVLNVADPDRNMPKECKVEYACGKGKPKEITVGDGQVGTLTCK